MVIWMAAISWNPRWVAKKRLLNSSVTEPLFVNIDECDEKCSYLKSFIGKCLSKKFDEKFSENVF